MKKMKHLAIAGPLVLLLSGCMMPMNDDNSARVVQDRTELASLRSDVDALKERIVGNEKGIQEVRERLESLKTVAAADSRETRESLAVIEKALKNSESAHEELKKQIIADLAEKISRIPLSAQTPSTVRSHPRGGTNGDTPKEPKGGGKEHIVKAGDTLVSIATLHKVKLSELMQSNNLKDDKIRVGQKLTIPE
jgi:LysM repeat protein